MNQDRLIRRLNRRNGNQGAFFEYVPPLNGDKLCWFCRAPVDGHSNQFVHAYGETIEKALSGVLLKMGALIGLDNVAEVER